MEIEDFVAKLDGVRQLPSGISARCPAHDDHVASLSVGCGENGGVVVHCHAGCTVEAIVAAMGLTMVDLQGLPHITNEHPYTHNGQILWVVERWANPKTFRCRPGLPPPSERVLYNEPAINWCRANHEILNVVEGERDVDNCDARGIPATTNVGGAGKWSPQNTEQVAGISLRIVADNDAPGRAHARAVAAATRKACPSVELTHSRIGKDLTDAFNAGYGLEALEPLTEYEDVSSYVASSIRVRRINWGWVDYLPMGKLSMIEGDPGDGKSILSVDLAARWSTGSPMPDGTNGAGPWPVIMVSAEDDPEDTIVPRLVAAGADLDRIHVISHGLTPDVPFEFVDGLPGIHRLVERSGARAVFFDPLMAFMGGNTDTHNDASVRRALQPLKTLASQTGAAVVVIRHLNKGGGGTKAIYRGGGSIGFTGAARATYLVTSAPDDPKTRVFACVKNNLAAKPPSLTYTVETSTQGVPYIAWGGAVDLTAQTALDGPRRGEREEDDETRTRRSARRMAGQFLVDLLENGPLTWKEILIEGKEQGFSAMTLERARAEVNLTKLTGDAGQRTTLWASPSTPPEAPFPHFVTSPSPTSGTPRVDEMRKWEDEDEVEAREAKLMEEPLICAVCHTDVNVSRYAEPHWTVRCVNHNPITYGG